MADIKKVTEGMTGAEASQTLYDNDINLNNDIAAAGNRIPVYNVTTEVPLPTGEYYTFETATAAVPASVRKLGLIIEYQVNLHNWQKEQFIRGNAQNDTSWNNPNLWEDVTIREVKKQLLKNRSFSGMVDIDADHVANITTGDITYIKAAQFDTAYVDIFDGSTSLAISGVVQTRTLFFTDYIIDTAHYISNSISANPAIPVTAKFACITLLKSDNPSGYNDMRVMQNGAGATRLDVNTLSSTINKKVDTGELYSIPGSIRVDGALRPLGSDPLSATNYLPITGLDPIETKGANSTGTNPATGITPIAFYDIKKRFISAYIGVSSSNRIYSYAVSDIPEGAKYIRCTRNDNADTDWYIKGVNLASLAAEIMRETEETNKIEFRQKVVGKNLINPDDLLYGITYSSSSGLIVSANGIMSNKMRLRPGRYTLQGLSPYFSVPLTCRILAFNDSDEMVRADIITLDAAFGKGNYTVGVGGTYSNAYISYWRLVLQFDTRVIFNPNTVQFEFGAEATSFEECKTELVFNPSYSISPRTVFMTGASSSMPGNGYFENACEELGFKPINRAVSGDTVMMHATAAWRGTLYTEKELEDIDIFVTSHIHNYDVNWNGKRFESSVFDYGYYSTNGAFTSNSAWVLDKYLLSIGDTNLLASVIGNSSTTPYALFFDKNNNMLGYDIVLDGSATITPIVDYELTIPTGTHYVLLKRRNVKGYLTELRGKTTGIIQKTIADYEAKGYSLATNQPLTVPMDKNNPDHIIVPYGGGGAPGPQSPSDLYDERYSAGYDYLLKKYTLDCYNLKDNPNSKWYGTKSGKPVIIVCTTQWNDAYVRFNDSVKLLAKRFGAVVANIAENIGFSYKQTNPFDDNSIRQSALHCNNAQFSGGSNDTENIPIHGVYYNNMGWHPTRDYGCYIQMKRGNILAEALKTALYNDAKFASY